MLTTSRRQLAATTTSVAQTTLATQMMTTRAVNTSGGNQRGIAGNCTSDCSSTGRIDCIGTVSQASGSAAVVVSAAPASSSDSASASVSATTTTSTAVATTALKTRTTITSDPGILCFHHCNVKVFCFRLPHICPQCKTPLDTQHPNGMKNKRQMKTKKRTSNANAAATANAKGRHHHTNNVETDNIDNNHDADDDTRYKLNEDGNTNKKTNDADADDDEHEDEDDEDEDEDEDEDSNKNSFVSHIMASRLLPFRLPYPFVRANQYPCAIVLRPTTGDFLNDYNNTTDLHIAVTTSTGCVVEFDRHGLRRHRTDNMSDWWQSLLVGDVPEPWYDYWDQVLFEICQQPDKWTVSHYHEDKHNCYTFVLTFLQALTYDKLSEAAASKTTFCEKYIVPRTTTAGKYISLYRKLRDTGIYVHHTNHHHNKLRHASSYGKGAHKHQHNNKLSNSTIAAATAAATTTAKNILQQRHHQNLHQQQHLQQQKQQQQHQQQQQMQQQKQHNHSSHHYSIISRPHSTLCTIEE